MLRFAFALGLLALTTAVPVVSPPEEGKRLIQFNQTGPAVWMTHEELFAYLRHDHECSGFMDITDHQHFHPSSLLPHPRIPTKAAHKSTVEAVISKLNTDRLIQSVTEMSTLFRPSRYYTTQSAREAAIWLKGQYETYAAAKNRAVECELFEHEWTQPSVLCRMPGKTKPDEKVIIGGHIDSINLYNPSGGVAPGADDDASGTSTVLEVFRAITDSGIELDRTVEFHGYAAEEVGLRGSQDVAADYQKRDEAVAAMLQLDMTLYRADDTVSLVNDYVSKDLTALLRQLVDTYCSVPWQDTECGYSCSDHASWHKAGYVAAFPFETPFKKANPDIHTPDDLVKNLDPAHGLEYAKLAAAFAVEVASTTD